MPLPPPRLRGAARILVSEHPRASGPLLIFKEPNLFDPVMPWSDLGATRDPVIVRNDAGLFTVEIAFAEVAPPTENMRSIGLVYRGGPEHYPTFIFNDVHETRSHEGKFIFNARALTEGTL